MNHDTDTVTLPRATATRFAKAVCDMFEGDAHWSILDLDGARDFLAAIGYTPSAGASSVEDPETGDMVHSDILDAREKSAG